VAGVEPQAPPADRPPGDLADRPGPADDFDDREYRSHIAGRALQLLQAEFAPATWKAFWGVDVESPPAVQVAGELGITPNAVYLAHGRVLRQLREELAGLVE
jgi:RNA polymerase sigma-70 factor (ECF subfamily)